MGDESALKLFFERHLTEVAEHAHHAPRRLFRANAFGNTIDALVVQRDRMHSESPSPRSTVAVHGSVVLTNVRIAPYRMGGKPPEMSQSKWREFMDWVAPQLSSRTVAHRRK